MRTCKTCRSCTPAKGEALPPLWERKLKPNRGSQQALNRRRSKLRLKSVGPVRAQASLKRKRSGPEEDRPATEPPRGSRDPPQVDRAHSEISLDVCAGSPPASAAESIYEATPHQCMMWKSSGSSSEECSRSCSANRSERRGAACTHVQCFGSIIGRSDHFEAIMPGRATRESKAVCFRTL